MVRVTAKPVGAIASTIKVAKGWKKTRQWYINLLGEAFQHEIGSESRKECLGHEYTKYRPYKSGKNVRFVIPTYL